MEDILLKYAEPVPDNWKLVASEPVELDENGVEIMTASLKMVQLAYASSYGTKKENINRTKSQQDNAGFKVRYQYANSLSSSSREFCVGMVELKKSGYVFSKENIVKMGDAGVNKQFAPSGHDSYSIWDFKGGSYCHHAWQRLIYSVEEKRQVNRGYAQRRGYQQTVNAPTVATPPISMPNKGSLKNVS